MKEKAAKKILLAQIILYGLLFFSFNNKVFFPSIGLFSLYLFYLLEDWKKAAWLILVAIFPFGWGVRTFKIEIPLPFYFLSPRETPFLHFSLTARFLISFFLLIVLAFQKKKEQLRLGKKDLLLFGFLILAGFSTLNSQNLAISMIGFLEIFQAAVVYYLALYFLKDKSLLRLTVCILFIAAVFEGGWALAQLILRRPLGRILEESLMMFPSGKRAAEDIFQYRSSGTFTDPITLAIFLSLVFPLILSQAVQRASLIKNNLFKWSTLTFCFLGIISNFSRGAWLIIFGASSVLLFYLFKKQLLRPFKKNVILGLAAGFLLLLPLIIPRLLSLEVSLWSKYSSISSRIELIKEAVAMIKQAPFLGVGPGNFLPVMAQNRATDASSHFFYPVHNLYLLFAAEVGIPATIAFLGFIYLVLKESLTLKTNEGLLSLKLGIWGSILVYFLSSLIYNRVIGVNMQLLFLLLAMLISL